MTKNYNVKPLTLKSFKENIGKSYLGLTLLTKTENTEILGCFDETGLCVGFCFYIVSEEKCTVQNIKTINKDLAVKDVLLQNLVKLLHGTGVKKVVWESYSAHVPEGFFCRNYYFHYIVPRELFPQFANILKKIAPLQARLEAKGYTCTDFQNITEEQKQRILEIYNSYKTRTYADGVSYLDTVLQGNRGDIDKQLSSLVWHKGKIVAFVIFTDNILNCTFCYRATDLNYQNNGAVHWALLRSIKEATASNYKNVIFEIKNTTLRSLALARVHFPMLPTPIKSYIYECAVT